MMITHKTSMLQTIMKGRALVVLLLVLTSLSLSFSLVDPVARADVSVVYWSENISSFVIPNNECLTVKNATVAMDINVNNLTSKMYTYNVSLVANFTITGITNRTNTTLGFVYPYMWNAYENETYSNITNIEIFANETLLNYTLKNGSELKTDNEALLPFLDNMQVFMFNVTLSENETLLISVNCNFFAVSAYPKHIIDYIVATASCWKGNITETIFTRIRHPINMTISFSPPTGTLREINETYLEYQWVLNKTTAMNDKYIEVEFEQYPYQSHSHYPRPDSPFFFLYIYHGPPNPLFNFLLWLVTTYGETGAIIALIAISIPTVLGVISSGIILTKWIMKRKKQIN